MKQALYLITYITIKHSTRYLICDVNYYFRKRRWLQHSLHASVCCRIVFA